MAKNKPTPLKDEPIISLSDIHTEIEGIKTRIDTWDNNLKERIVLKPVIQVQGLHFNSKEEFHENVALLFKCLSAYNQEQEDAYVEELHKKGELSNRELLVTIYNKLCSTKSNSKEVMFVSKKTRLMHFWQKIKSFMFKVFNEPSNKWYRNPYAWICIFLTLIFSAFTTYEIININRMKTYNAELRTIAAQHQMTHEIVREFQPDLYVTISSYDDMVRSKGYSYAHEHFEDSKSKEKPGK